MSRDFMLEIAPDLGGQLRLKLSTPGQPFAPVAGQEFLRQPLVLDPAKLDLLRQDKASPLDLLALQTSVAQWLFGMDLIHPLNAALAAPGEPLRLILNISDRLLTALADTPFELLEYNGAPLVLDPHVEALIHLLPKIGVPPPIDQTWPLRVLLVRSNPVDLGGAVPPATPLRDHLITLAGQIAAQVGQPVADLVQVDLMSREPGAMGLPTWDAVRQRLKAQSTPYHILVYLGHGDLRETQDAVEPSGVLQFESEDGQTNEPIFSKQLKVQLQNHPVPLVLLTGCLTASQIPPALQADIEMETPRWMRGSQGVAQALVNSQSGVQVTVGMRALLPTVAATVFLEAFFDSLLVGQPGHVERAVRAGRDELFQNFPHSPSWAAPMLFRAPGAEPLFAFLVRPPDAPPNLEDERDRDYRRFVWNNLVQRPLAARPPGSVDFLYDILKKADQDLRTRALGRGPVLWPGWYEQPPKQALRLPVELYGPLNVSMLRGRFSVVGDDIQLERLEETAGLTQSGFVLLSSKPKANQIEFRIERNGGGAALPDGPLFEAELTLGDKVSVVYPVAVEVLATQPVRTVRSGDNAILVPPP